MINKTPYIEVPESEKSCWEGWESIGKVLLDHIKSLPKKKVVIAIEANLGTHLDSNLHAIRDSISPNVTCRAKDIYKDENVIRQLTKNDQYSSSTTNSIEDYFDVQKLEGLQNNIDFIDEGVILIHGIGSSKIVMPDILIYSDISRWEQLQRFRRGEVSNIGVNNVDTSYQNKEKWNYFIDWRICDKIKKKVITTCDYFLETNNWKKPKLATGEIIRKGYEVVYSQPFFNAPFFDPELWESSSDISQDNDDFKWVFNCNMDKNNILLKLGPYLFESPAINLIYFNPSKILGNSVYKKFGLELPIRYNFVDTLDEKDINIYMYPGVEFFKDHYGIYHKQYENFYVMDAERNGEISIGLEEGISKEYFEEMALDAKTKKAKIHLQKLLKTIKLQKHDHLTVPEEVLHTKGNKLMILSITTSPSLFELSLFDEKEQISTPDHFNQLLQLTSNFSEDYLNNLNNVKKGKDSGVKHELLGFEENKEYSLKRIWIDEPIKLRTLGTVNVLNLIEGEQATVTGDFTPFVVHYAETFVVPASVKEYTINPPQDGRACVLLTMVK